MGTKKSITQKFAGIVQISNAIELYYTGNYISAITLAGAAEEIFGMISKELGRSNSFETEKFLFGTSGFVDYWKYRNKVRNELKHITTDKRISYNDLKTYALQLIGSAVINYKLANGRLAKDKTIAQFCEDVGIN